MEKIYLEKGEQLHNEPNRIVCITGEYEPDELVLVCELNNPKYPQDLPLYQYSANYIKYGKE